MATYLDGMKGGKHNSDNSIASYTPKKKKFNVGDIVKTKTHAVYQPTQESLDGLVGIVANNDDPYDIHVDLLDFDGYIGFSEFELSIVKDKKELKTVLLAEVVKEMKDNIENNDWTAIEELLSFIPVENQIQFLSEDEWKKYKKLWTPK